jgi:hypothetical protein
MDRHSDEVGRLVLNVQRGQRCIEAFSAPLRTGVSTPMSIRTWSQIIRYHKYNFTAITCHELRAVDCHSQILEHWTVTIDNFNCVHRLH